MAVNSYVEDVKDVFTTDLNGDTALRTVLEGTTGDLTVNGDLTVTETTTTQNDEVVQGTILIDVDDAEAFLVRKDGDGGDVFVVDTVNDSVAMNTIDSVSTVTEVNSAFNVNARLKMSSNTSVFFGTSFETTMSYNGTLNKLILDYDDNGAGVGSFDLVSNDSTVLFADNSGNVGIGKNNPGELLDVDGAVLGTQIKASSSIFTDNISSFSGSGIDFNSSESNSRWLLGGAGSIEVVDDLNKVLARFEANGNVGIGTNSPSSLLDISSLSPTITFTDEATSSQVTLDYDSSRNDNEMQLTLPSGGEVLNISNGVNSTRALTVDGAFEVTSSAAGFVFSLNQTSTGDIAKFQNSGTTKSVITSDGSFGIGTSTPSHPLVVADSNANNIMDVREADTTVFYNGIDAGPIQAAEDTYQQLIDQDITSALTAGDQVGYTFAVDNSAVMEVSAEADGSGGVQKAKAKFSDLINFNVRSTTPSNAENGDVYLDDGTNTTSGNYALRVYNGTSWVDMN